jgi:PAS domain S-box-containing protein/putative nucleotidyltransferase with HDIG domain
LQLLAEHSYDMIAELTPQRQFSYLNPRCEPVLGYSTLELLGCTADMYIHPEDRRRCFSALSRMLRLQREAQWVFRFRHQQGEWRWLECHGMQITTPGQEPRIVVIAHDISERKRADEELLRYRLLCERTRDIILIQRHEDGRLIEANQAAVAAYGYSRDELLTRSMQDLSGPNTHESISKLLEQADSASATFETIHRRKDGCLFSVEVSSCGAMLDGEQVYLKIIRDITERRQAEERLLQQTTRAEALVQTARALNAQLDMGSVMQTVCDKAAQTLGLPAALMFFDERSGREQIAASSTDIPSGYLEDVLPLLRKYIDRYITQPMLIVSDVRDLHEEAMEMLFRKWQLCSLIYVPLRRDNQVIGALSVRSFGTPHHFSEDEQALLQGLADQAAQAIVNARLFEDANRRLHYLQALRDVDKAITTSFDLDVMLDIFLHQVMTQLDVHAADVLLFDQDTQTLDFAAGRGFRSRVLQHTRLRLGDGYAGQAALERRMISHADLTHETDGPVNAPLFDSEGFVSYYAVPLIAKGQVQGVLELFHRRPLDPDEDWLNLLDALARQAAIAINNASLFEALQLANTELTLAYDTTLEGWSRALDMRDEETEGHSLRVTDLTVRLAEAMGIPKGDFVHIRRGALLHDIGKMGIPDHILLKPGALTEDEWQIMSQHPLLAYQLLSPITFLRAALNIPYCHHEKWDGSGYPRGLRGADIPIEARIFAVVDVWDALCSDRPYRRAWKKDDALDYIRAQAEHHFDPRVIAVFLELLSKLRDDSSFI